MKSLLLVPALLLGLSARQPAQAQQLPAAPAARPLRFTHDDSLAVLHQMFRRARRSGRIGALADGALLPLNIANLASPSGTDFQRGVQFSSTLFIGGGFVNGVLNWVRFSQRREREAVLRFEQRQVQPLYVQRSYALALIARSNPRY